MWLEQKVRAKNRTFIKVNLYTIIAVYFLILVGGIVRNMGAGMGCPDWPKCFGRYIPLTSSEYLPDGYQDAYVEARIAKNTRLSSVLGSLGFTELAQKVLNDPNIHEKHAFDTKKAWVEYLNRLVGVVIGLLIILNLIFAFRTGKRSIIYLAVASLVLVLFQGWIGSLVVSTNLLPGFISFHMVLAILLVVLLQLQRQKVVNNKVVVERRALLSIMLICFGVQIVLGTQIREQIDLMHSLGMIKAQWVNGLGAMFYFHRSYSLLLVGMVIYFIYQNRFGISDGSLKVLFGVVVLEVILGAVMIYFDFPISTQPLHLLLGIVTFGMLFSLFLRSDNNITVLE